jgi:hypothetical protein
MEILDLRFAGISLGTWLGIAALFFLGKGIYAAYQDWAERRQWRKQYEVKKRKWDSENHWEPNIINGVDRGEWVRNDGRPIDEDEWTPVGELFKRLEDKGPGSG